MNREVILVEEVDQHDAAILQRVTLPDGDRAEARRRLVLDVLCKHSAPWMAILIDTAVMPQHLYVVVARKDRDGAIDLTEFAESRQSERGRASAEGIEHYLRSTNNQTEGPEHA